MIAKIKRDFKLLRYGYHFELNILGIVICTIAGLIQLIFMSSLSFLLISFLYIITIASTLEISGIVKSSPKFKSFYFGIQRIVNIASCLLYFTSLFVIRLIQAGSLEKLKLVIGNELVMSGIYYIILVFYMSIAFKYFFISTAVFLGGYFSSIYIFAIFDKTFKFTLMQGILIAFICVVIGMLLSEILKRASYKKPLSKNSLGRSIRKYYF